MKKFQIFLVLILLFITNLIIWMKPRMHKAVKFENAEMAVKNQDINSMTPQEKIVWNKWRSDIVNKIMQNTKISITEEPLGTNNIIEFTIDRNRNISNIKISTDPPEYTKIAQTHFFKSINELDGDFILNFPKDTNRKIITFKNYFVTGNKTQYTKPGDFSDYETIKR